MVKKTKKEPKIISKPEDKQWLDWYNKLSPEEHKDNMKKLGLSLTDINDAEFLESKNTKKKKD